MAIFLQGKVSHVASIAMILLVTVTSVIAGCSNPEMPVCCEYRQR